MAQIPLEPLTDAESYQLLAELLPDAGAELYELRFRDLRTGDDLADRIPNTYYGTAWATDNATLFYVLYLYRQAFENFRMGYASALAMVLFAVIMALTALSFRLSRRYVFYAGER